MNSNEEYLKKIHEEILEIMDMFHDVCAKNNLQYYLIGGTLLGAVRHKGFIPWDDDLDVVMPRTDYERLINDRQLILPDGYELFCLENRNDYYKVFAKVVKKGTLFREELIDDNQANWGIYIDIFPIDDISGYSAKIDRRKGFIKKLQYAMFVNIYGSSNVFKSIIYKSVPIGLMKHTVRKITHKESQKLTDFYTNYGSQYSAKKQTMPKAWFGSGTLLDFEGKKYIAPAEYLKVLNSIFGEKYMELPPVEKRKTHCPSKVVFSDGTKMEFEKQIKKLTVEESLDF